MSFIYVCNTASDYISRVKLDTFEEDCKIHLNETKGLKSGPHDIFFYKKKLFVANCYSNMLTIVDTEKNRVEESYFIGAHCNGVVVNDNTAYIICGELNNVILFNLEKRKIMEVIPCGVSPHSIKLDGENKCIVIANMESNSITILDCMNKQEIRTIQVGNYPTKAIFSSDNKHILVCESNLETEKKGWIGVVSITEGKVLYRIPVGKYPVDICNRSEQCIVSNFGEGSISIVDLKVGKEIQKIYVGGMPRGILYSDPYIYIGDNYGNVLLQIDSLKRSKKVIAIGKEPTGMTFVTR